MSKQQQYTDVRLVVHNNDGEPLSHGVDYQGRVCLVDEGMLDALETLHFFIDEPQKACPRNRIVFKGLHLTCRLRKDGRYGISLCVKSKNDLTDTLQQVLRETLTVFATIKADISEREACHAI